MSDECYHRRDRGYCKCGRGPFCSSCLTRHLTGGWCTLCPSGEFVMTQGYDDECPMVTEPAGLAGMPYPTEGAPA